MMKYLSIQQKLFKVVYETSQFKNRIIDKGNSIVKIQSSVKYRKQAIYLKLKHLKIKIKLNNYLQITYKLQITITYKLLHLTI